MKAVRYSEYGQRPELVDVPAPECPDSGVLLRVAATGVCRSDWHAWQGHDPVALPHIPGHEMAGTVAATGSEVSGWRVGDRVTVPFVCGCGTCEYCHAGDPQVCPEQTQPGFTGPGSFAELVAIHAADANLVALPQEVDFPAAAALGCRFATAYRALAGHARLRPGEWLAVHGCGGVGLSAVQIGTALGARVLAVDLAEGPLRRAAELGAHEVLHAGATGDIAAAVADRTGGGAHVAVDALGSAPTAVASVRCLRRRGRHVQIGLLFGEAARPPLPMDLVIAHELTIHGTHGMAAHEYPAMLELIVGGRLRPESLIGEEIGLEHAGTALTAMSAGTGGAGMTIVRPG